MTCLTGLPLATRISFTLVRQNRLSREPSYPNNRVHPKYQIAKGIKARVGADPNICVMLNFTFLSSERAGGLQCHCIFYRQEAFLIFLDFRAIYPCPLHTGDQADPGIKLR